MSSNLMMLRKFTVGGFTFQIWRDSVKSAPYTPPGGQIIRNFAFLRIFPPTGFIVIGGGANVSWTKGTAAFLTSIYPNSDWKKSDPHFGDVWEAGSKDQGRGYETPHTLTAYAVCVSLTAGPALVYGQDYTSQSVTSVLSETPTTITQSPGRQWQLVGGGAKTIFKGNGQLLTSSYPAVFDSTDPYSQWGWAADSTDHYGQDGGTVTAYAMYLSSSLLATNGGVMIGPYGPVTQPPPAVPKPSTPVQTAGAIVIGGGGIDNYTTYGNKGNMLTASCPDDKSLYTWWVEGTDIDKPNPSTISAWAIVATQPTCCMEKLIGRKLLAKIGKNLPKKRRKPRKGNLPGRDR